MRLHSIQVRNFKAIVNSHTVKLGALTAFIGHNGAGKSSLIEALETYQSIVRDGLDRAMQRWLGMEHIRHKAQEARGRRGQPLNPIGFDLTLGPSPRKTARLSLAANHDTAADRMAITAESVRLPGGNQIGRNALGAVPTGGPGRSILTVPPPELADLATHVLGWQFLTLAPDRMGMPVPQQRTEGRVRLARDGSNVADALLDLRRTDPNAFDGIVQTMSFVLPYAKDIQPSLTSSEIERKAWLQLAEADFKVPGWLMSSGTLRMLALLTLLRHPSPPPLIVVEEIENGLDPRSIHLIVDEIRHAVLSGLTQVILTTHSPYLLDLLTLDHLVLVQRNGQGQPVFTRPSDDASLTRWAHDFAPGKLYTMGNLTEPRA